MRICESNSPNCSGINPCDYCYAFIFAKVLPGVIRAGGLNETPASAEARMKAYDEGWRKALTDRLAEKNAALPATLEPYTTGTLLEFLAFKEARRERLVQKKALETQAGLDSKTDIAPVTSEKGFENVIGTGLVPQNAGPVTTKGKSAKSAKLVRGELKRMAEKTAKQSLAPGNGIEVDPGVSLDNGTNPADGRTGRH